MVLYRQHWILVAINAREGLIHYMDPIGGHYSQRPDMVTMIERCYI